MPRLRIPRLSKCLHDNCNERGLAQDGYCINHTQCDYNRSKSPNLFQNPFGMELELVSHKRHIRKLVHLSADDGSLPCHGHEIKNIDESNMIGRSTGRIARNIKIVDPEASVTRECGFHVHMSLKLIKPSDHYSAREMIEQDKRERTYQTLFKIEDELYSLFRNRRRTGGYCHTLNEVMNNRDNWTRYGWLSFSGRYPTLECRIHSGTLNHHKIIAWAQVCRGLQKLCFDLIEDKDTRRVELANNGEFINLFAPGSTARHYLEARKEANGSLRGYRIP